MLNKSTDVGNAKRLITYVRYRDDNMIKKLFRNSETEDGRADAIVEDVKQLLTEKNLNG